MNVLALSAATACSGGASLMATRDHCSGAYYVNMSIDADRIQMLDEQLTQCHYAQPVPDTGDHCGECAEEACSPACVDGVCTQASENECHLGEE